MEPAHSHRKLCTVVYSTAYCSRLKRMKCPTRWGLGTAVAAARGSAAAVTAALAAILAAGKEGELLVVLAGVVQVSLQW